MVPVVVVVVVAAKAVVLAIVVARVVEVVVAREVLVDEEVEAGLRLGRPVAAAGGGASALGASAGEHAAVKTAATAKAQAKRLTANGFPEDTRTTLGDCCEDVIDARALIVQG